MQQYIFSDSKQEWCHRVRTRKASDDMCLATTYDVHTNRNSNLSGPKAMRESAGWIGLEYIPILKEGEGSPGIHGRPRWI